MRGNQADNKKAEVLSLPWLQIKVFSGEYEINYGLLINKRINALFKSKVNSIKHSRNF